MIINNMIIKQVTNTSGIWSSCNNAKSNLFVKAARVSMSVSSNSNKLGFSRTSKFVSRLLDRVKIIDSNNSIISNEDNQRRIESTILDEFYQMFGNNKNSYMLGGINTQLLGSSLSKFVITKEKLLRDSIKNMLKDYKNIKHAFMSDIISTAGSDHIYNVCVMHFIYVYAF